MLLALCAASLWGCQSRMSFARDLTSDDPVLRKQSIQKLVTMKPSKKRALISPLIQKLRDPNPLVADRAATVLSEIGPQALEKLTLVLTDQDPYVVSLAIEVIGNMGPEGATAIPALIATSYHAHPIVREEVITSLGKIGVAQKEAILTLENALNDDEKWVRDEAKWALQTIDLNKRTDF